jgi:hypothetical protein
MLYKKMTETQQYGLLGFHQSLSVHLNLSLPVYTMPGPRQSTHTASPAPKSNSEPFTNAKIVVYYAYDDHSSFNSKMYSGIG